MKKLQIGEKLGKALGEMKQEISRKGMWKVEESCRNLFNAVKAMAR